MRRIVAVLFALWPTFAAAQTPAPVPALPDTPRITQYSLNSSMCTCAVNFALYGDMSDVDNWLQVFIGSTEYLSTDPNFGWTITSPSGPIGQIALPITNAVLTFNQQQTGNVTILGAQRPRRLSEFQENAGVPARNLNQTFNTIFAELRENWDKVDRSILGQPGEVLNLLPPASTRAGNLLAFDQMGQPNIQPIQSVVPGNVVGPNSSTNATPACFNGTSGQVIDECGATEAIVLSSIPSISITVAPTATIPTSSLFYPPIGAGIFSTSDNAPCTQCTSGGQFIPTLFTVEQNLGGSNINQGRNAISALQQFTAPTSPTNPYRFYVALNALENVETGDNGTTGTPLGVFEGITSQVQTQSGATSLSATIGLEISLSIVSGSSVAKKAYLLMDGFPADAVQGTQADTFIWTFGQGGVGATSWAKIDSTGGSFPLATTSDVIQLIGPYTITNGFDFGSGTITGNVLQWGSGMWGLNGSGNATLNNIKADGGVQFTGQLIANGQVGATCSPGSPTSSFAVNNGVVIHC